MYKGLRVVLSRRIGENVGCYRINVDMTGFVGCFKGENR